MSAWWPSFLDDEKITNVNLWVSVNGSKSSTHYDPYQNLLCVVAGEKTVSLWDPRATPGLYPMALHGEAFNHSAVNFAAPDHARYPRYRTVLESRKIVTVRAGDALFIPDGWWHQVDSAGTTIAVNVWWQSRFSAMLGTHMDAYYARQAIASLLFTEKKRRLDDIRAYQSAGPAACSDTRSSQGGPHLQNPYPPGQTIPKASSEPQLQTASSTALPVSKAAKKRKGRKKAAANSRAHLRDLGKTANALIDGEAREEPGGHDSELEQVAANPAKAAHRRAGDMDGCGTSREEGSAAAGLCGIGATPGEEEGERAGPGSSDALPGEVVPPPPRENGISADTLAESGAQLQNISAATRNVVESGDRLGEEEPQSSGGFVGAETPFAHQRRHVVQCLSPEEAQLLQTLVLQAGQRHDRTGTVGTDGTAKTRQTDEGECGGSVGERRLRGQLNGSAVRRNCKDDLESELEGGGSGADAVAGVFAVAETAQLRRVLLAMAIAFPRALERLVLYGLSPIAAELLTTRFDDFDNLEPTTDGAADHDPLQVDPPAAFFERFYAVFEDRNAAMAALLDGKEAFAAEALQDLLGGLQGVSDVSAQSGMTKEPLQ